MFALRAILASTLSVTAVACAAAETSPAPTDPAPASSTKPAPTAPKAPAATAGNTPSKDNVQPSATGGGVPVTAPPPVSSAPVSPLPRVCAGAQGDGGGIASVEWKLYPLSKYTLPLGAGLDEQDFLSEPTMLSVKGVTADRLMVTGTPSLDPAMLSTGTSSPRGDDTFGIDALPATSTADHVLGFSDTAQLIYRFATIYGGATFEETTAFRVYTSTVHDDRIWTLARPTVDPDPEMGPQSLYVSDFHATVGTSWIMAIHFDQPCKADALAALVQGNPWDPINAALRPQVQDFLVANKAVFKLHVLQTGPEDAGLKAALAGTTCAPSDLAACQTMFDGLKAARTTFLNAPLGADDYGALTTNGNVGPWVIGSVHAVPVSSVP
jgi:hypothetical protein